MREVSFFPVITCGEHAGASGRGGISPRPADITNPPEIKLLTLCDQKTTLTGSLALSQASTAKRNDAPVTASFENLPEEIVSQIFIEVNEATCLAVSKKLAAVFGSSPEIQEKQKHLRHIHALQNTSNQSISVITAITFFLEIKPKIQDDLFQVLVTYAEKIFDAPYKDWIREEIALNSILDEIINNPGPFDEKQYQDKLRSIIRLWTKTKCGVLNFYLNQKIDTLLKFSKPDETYQVDKASTLIEVCERFIDAPDLKNLIATLQCYKSKFPEKIDALCQQLYTRISILRRVSEVELPLLLVELFYQQAQIAPSTTTNESTQGLPHLDEEIEEVD